MNPLLHADHSREKQIVVVGIDAVCALGNPVSEDSLEFHFPKNPIMRV